jgi:hypothetical protein
MSWDSFYKNGYILYCPVCREYIRQTDPQNFSLWKQVIIDDVPCETCTKKNEEEIKEAQEVMGRLGLSKESK